jgi:PAS domain S-box-containing protein
MPAKYSVLYVDDEPVLLELGTQFLEQSGRFSVTTAASAPVAMELLKQQPFDAIVSDYQMPVCNGLQFLRELRKDSDLPFILFTGKGREEVVIEAINTGADFYLQKGGDPKAQFAELGHKIVQAVSKRKAEQLYRTVFESTGTGMMILDEDKTISAVNREMERISGFSRAEIEGKIPWTAFVSAEDVERMKQYHIMRRDDPMSVPKNYEFGFLDRHGKVINTYITVEMIPGTTKSVVSLIDISRESVAKQELADSEEKFRSLTESLPEGVYMIQENRFVYINHAFCRIIGYTQAQLLDLPDFSVLFPEPDRSRIRQVISDRLSGIQESNYYTVQCTQQDGTLIPITVHGSKTRYKGKPAIIGVITDARK